MNTPTAAPLSGAGYGKPLYFENKKYMLLIQILFLAFIVFSTATIFIRYKEKHLTAGQTAAWLLFWLAAAVIILLPETTSFLAKILGVTRGVDLIVYVAIVILFYAIFKIQLKFEKIEREITKIVQDRALKKK